MSSWFQHHIRHCGKATLEFGDPQGTIAGEGFVEIDERGSIAIQLRVDEYQLEEAKQIEGGLELEYLLCSNKSFAENEGEVRTFSLAPDNTCTSFKLEAPEGTVRAGGSIAYTFGNDNDGNYVLNVMPLWLQFDALARAEATYWALPLSNFVANFLQSPSSSTEANPLRFGSGKYNLIEFEFRGRSAFIERVPDYAHRVREIQEGRATNRLTSVMIGEVAGEQCDSLEVLEEWFPLHLLGVLSLTTGSEVGSPWIELRDDTGQLVRRFYTRAPAPIYVPGHVAVNDALGIERVSGLLTAASHHEASQKLNESYLRVTMKLMLRAKLETATLEESLANVSRAVDGLCEKFGLKEGPNVKSILNESQKGDLKRILKDAADSIRKMADNSAQTGQQEQTDVLKKISNNVADARSLHTGYGKAVVALLEKFNLPDERIVSPYIEAHSRYEKEKSFADLVSRYRGRAIHVNYLGVTRANLNKAHNAIILIDHLHDILLRIVLKIIDYSGTYNPTVVQGFDMRLIDWVDSTTTPQQLGYERFD